MSEPTLDKARALFLAKQYDGALATLDGALAVTPDRAELWNNRGTILAALNRLDEACDSFARALGLRAEFPAALGNRANALLALGRYEEAARDYERALAAYPDLPYGRGNLLHARLQNCDWRDFSTEEARLIADVRAGKRAASPIAAAALFRDPEDQLRAARILAADKYPPAPPFWRGERYAHERIRIAYLSADFSGHATATLMAGVFESHDPARFETAAISFGAHDASPMRARLENAFSRFIDVAPMSDAEIAAKLRDMEIDIAIDLKGYTSHARPGIFAHRPAPVQASYLGFPGTMGVSFMDYIIADATVIPETAMPHYSEKVVTLPDTYQANDAKRVIADTAPNRADAGLPQDGFVFCCFNNAYKILPAMFDVWMRLLRVVDGSVLWLLEESPVAVRNLRQEAQARGVNGDRLVFAPRIAPEDHLARHRLADLFLDTLPYNAHTTASDALWAGLPIVTCFGETFASRVAASLLNAAGLIELITPSVAAYEALAFKLATSPAALSAIREKLAASRTASALFDTARFTRHLESAYATMHGRAIRGLAPEAFAVAPIVVPAPG